MCASLTTNILRIRRQCCVSVYVYQRCDVMAITSIACTLIFIVDHLNVTSSFFVSVDTRLREALAL